MKKLLAFLFTAMIIGCLFLTYGCTPASQSIDWTLQGVWVDTNGTVQENRAGVEISVSGDLPTEFENRGQVDVKMNFTWPGCTINPDTGAKSFSGFAQFADKHNNQAFYHIPTWLYYLEENEVKGVSFFLCPEEGFLVAKVRDDYLVASTDENADTEEIFTFYKAYVYVRQ